MKAVRLQRLKLTFKRKIIKVAVQIERSCEGSEIIDCCKGSIAAKAQVNIQQKDKLKSINSQFLPS